MSFRIPPKKLPKRTEGVVRIANAPFLNSVPYSLSKRLSWAEYQEVVPAECGRMLFEDEADVALIPAAEWFATAREGEYELLPFGIAATNPVTSVVLFSECPPEELSEVYVDQSSRSSVALLRVLLGLRGRSWKEIRYHRVASAVALANAGKSTGALVIGDAARAARGKFAFELDLAEAWKSATKLPMVFAVWAARKDVLSEKQREELLSTFQEGVEARSVLARSWCDERGERLERELEAAETYVNAHIEYRLSGSHLRGAAELRSLGIHFGLFAASCPVLDYRPAIAETRGSTLDGILARAANGERISVGDALELAARASLADLSIAANERRIALNPDRGVSYIVDRNINYTNVCNVFCRFCAFYRAPGKAGGYVLSHEEIGKKIEEMIAAGGIQILLQGGLHPELGIEYYEDLFRWIKARYPINLHALSADEIIHITRVSGISIEETLSRLIVAGLGSLPGGGAEILVSRVRTRVARLKSSTEEWLEVHRTAHRLGLRSSSTMMFGVQETWEDRIFHLNKLRSLQDDTGGFTAFITWPFQDDNLKLERGDTSASEYLRVQAIARLFLDNIAHIQGSWVTMGPSVGQVALEFGADDFGSVMFEENVVSSAGTTYCLDNSLLERHITEAGFRPWRRNIHYAEVA